MLKPQKPDGPRGMGRIARWVYTPVANGTSTTGWLAGPTCGVWAHFSGGTKPCKRRMTASALTCPFCEGKYTPVWRGYVPYYDAEYTRRFVLISEDHLECVDELPHLAMIRVKRGKGSRQPVVISRDAWRVTPLPPSEERAQPADLMPFLLRLWKDEELLAWALAQVKVTVLPERDRRAAVPPAIEERRKKSAALPPEKRLVVKNGEDLVPVGDLFPHLTAMKNGKNGHHKPTE